MAGADFASVLEITLFCSALFLAGLFCKRVRRPTLPTRCTTQKTHVLGAVVCAQFGVSTIIGEMIIGVILGPNGVDLVPYEQFFRLAGVFGVRPIAPRRPQPRCASLPFCQLVLNRLARAQVTLMIFESGLHVDFTMLKKVGGMATVVAIGGTFLPLVTGMFLIMLYDADQYTLWPVGLACGVTLAPTSVGMALKMLGERKQLGEEYGQLIVTAAFVDDIFSLVALTMLLQIGIAESSGDELSLWGVLKPLVFSTLFCCGGALMAMPLPRSPADGFVKKVLLRWIGVFPEFVPQLVFWFRSRSSSEDAKAIEAAQDAILQEYGIKMEETGKHLIEVIRDSGAKLDAAPQSPGKGKGASADKLRLVDLEIKEAIKQGQETFHRLVDDRAAAHKGDETEADIAQGVVHGKSVLFEGFLLSIGKLVEDLHHPTHLALDYMAKAHEIIHEKKFGDHKEEWSQQIEDQVEDRMKAWRDVHKIVKHHSSDIRAGGLVEFKEEQKVRTELVLNRAVEEVKNALESVATTATPRPGGKKGTVLSRVQQVAEDKIPTALVKLGAAMDAVQKEIDVIKVMNTVRSNIWDDWMGELLVELSHCEELPDGIILVAEELQHLQTHLFATKKGDIFDQHVHTVDDVLTFHAGDRINKEHVDPLLLARQKWRGEIDDDGSDSDEEDDHGHGHGSHKEIDLDLENKIILTLMFGLLVFYGWIANEIGSHLLGAFIAGMSFCWMDAALVLWHSQVKRIANWLIRLFFGATVAFSIPINIMMDVEALWKGAIMGAGPCCLTKILAGIPTGMDKWVVGFAMVGRGEFAYLVAQTAQATLLNPAPDSFSADEALMGRMVHMADGGYCLDGLCDAANRTVADAGRRRLAGGGGSSDPLWCKYEVCADADRETCEAAHTVPLPGYKYWQAGQDCGDHEDVCARSLPSRTALVDSSLGLI